MDAIDAEWLTYEDNNTKTGDATCTSDANEALCITKDKSSCLGYTYHTGGGNAQRCTLFDGIVSASGDTTADMKTYNRQ